ncbi:RHS repeat-associated core domain-containing protein [Microbulbifer thermotolerans]|uniref:RHS repeat-associated core domain-containing protein n=1 Tax=Microbulbifer thermotolerans TaxID=252514 RepID=A0AB35HYP3_MICTH|nr:RHS repeat-associated core domain-containing protein [Microbulbifer thermotolerans]MCX2783619.1 RHS repeat-associated core domain-containing protein [Microbulbifer thermotolerans]MCX2801994.1 RHS repeat-associated core domain-containing protein [Microbulbifer thermotolerans]MCX2833737.1 RHS repeat-associated core domain-containing protein [Microbulbifer thermotolerans]MCX2842076.1 RHS repeat-associated core domain-containing protein [Microbulbifer thermotolerans]
MTKVGTVSYEYDDNNGNLTSDSTGREFFYTSFDKPSLIKNTGSNDQTAFFYGPDRSRYKRIDTRTNGEVITTLYLGNVERIHRSSDGKYRWKRYLPGGGVFTYTTDADFNQQSFTEQYLLKDHIGSTDVVLDANGNILETMAFDPWGKRRDADWQAIDISDLVASNYSLLESLTDTTTKGFTGHEMVDALGVIHMNGRIYDPELGRFLQADPFIDGVGDTQGYNRYSYVKGNPLTLTDPTGYYSLDDFFDDVNKFLDKYIGDNGGSFEIGITYGGPGGTGNGAGWGGASFWAETGTGGASTPEGTVPGAFGESKKEEESIWDKITIQGTSENGGGFDSELAVESLVHLEVDGQSNESDTNLGFVAPGAPALTPTVQTPSPTASPGAAGNAAKVGLLARFATFVGLMSYSPSLNVGEDAQLAAMNAAIDSRISEAKARGEEAISLFRTAGPTEAADIRATGVFRLGPNQFPKQFTLSLKDAQAFQASLPASGDQYSNPDYMLPHTIFTGRVSFNTFRSLYPQFIADHGGTFIVTAPTTKHLGMINSDARRFGGIQELNTR